MAQIRGSVGKRGLNANDDVRTVQSLLNKHRTVPYRLLKVDGINGPETEAAIEEFQRRVVKLANPDGRVDPASTTWQALVNGQQAGLASGTSNLSGATWWHANQSKYPNSKSVDDLEPGFRSKVKEFQAALVEAGASITIASTKRNKHRAYLMHYCWQIAKGQIQAAKVPAEPGVDINWNHGNDAKSKQAAQEMVKLFGMAHIASLTSHHINGKAIDMTISWTGTLKIKNKSGQEIDVGLPRNGADNTKLHAVGATYGVKKLASDPPHWSVDGQ
jgi:hypothetical protein